MYLKTDIYQNIRDKSNLKIILLYYTLFIKKHTSIF